MTGVQFVTDEKGRKVGVRIDLKKHGALWQDFWDGVVSESRRKEKSVPYSQYRGTFETQRTSWLTTRYTSRNQLFTQVDDKNLSGGSCT
jgi:hypothetical protein